MGIMSAKAVLAAFTGVLALAGLTPPAAANVGCYIDYPGQSLTLEGLCAGEAQENAHRLRLRETLPVVQNVTMTGDFAQGYVLLGEVHNPHERMSDGVTIFYAVQTSVEMKTGTLVVSSLEAYGTESIAVDLWNLRGQLESYEFEIL
ncbi:MAG: hypothetical protein AAFZ80_05450 [Cyanobacteria bacterium P01_A01_bin.105]